MVSFIACTIFNSNLFQMLIKLIISLHLIIFYWIDNISSFYPHPRTFFHCFLGERKRGTERQREREREMQRDRAGETHLWVALQAPVGNGTLNLLVQQTTLQPTEPRWPGLNWQHFWELKLSTGVLEADQTESQPNDSSLLSAGGERSSWWSQSSISSSLHSFILPTLTECLPCTRHRSR